MNGFGCSNAHETLIGKALAESLDPHQRGARVLLQLPTVEDFQIVVGCAAQSGFMIGKRSIRRSVGGTELTRLLVWV